VSEPRPALFWGLFIGLLFVAVPAALFGLGSTYGFRVATVCAIFVILGVSMQLITGVAGLLSLGHAAFYGVGAYTAGLLATRLGWPFLLTLPAAGVMAALVGLLVAVPTMRLVSIYFAVATLGVGQMVFVTLLNWVDVTRGPLGIPGIPPISILGLDLSSAAATYMVAALVALFSTWIAHRIAHSYHGTALRALREDDQCADAMGLNVPRLKLEVFAVSSFLAGLAGALWAHSTGFVSPTDFRFAESILILAMVVVGGLGSIPGAVLGAVLLALLPEALRFVGDVRQIIVGLVMFGAILFLPKGLLGEVPTLAFMRHALGTGWRAPDGRRLGWQ
jgi:branched-chain amino acid transport system permease protein